jgi:NADPH:quinone reductase-like Zn-dependent oxidoreductase
MKALRFAKTGSLDELKIQEVPRPVPGPGSILVEVKAAISGLKGIRCRSGLTTF